ncbi:hypothetical protein SEA_SHAM4_91 [Mycobacterium phage Sham4]|uniref:hypothetical protein n=1 Tax=Mycobacterium phage Mulciber TaxID=1805459 RepID=UPI00078C424B|nr:hypothetical protein BJD74_gp15 [Mycobacterium phage Mulciber]AQT28264.1 hypothetical protein SEA_JABITH_94 [Mycobacterium phage Jabith]ASR86732.1 hypothetical protein SEA_ET2BRUTUS_94 [Mycobacterium phage Et2Brutus]AXC33451.1 hypothetical protein SEA_EBONY_93 [Mycobacterium phage Ebony]AXC33550.1 hypothetical protein SEA_JOSELITO_92 [Mycobacterium phage Joselito]AXH50773.1 hypothetical protein SEA_SNAPE_94 [Mycobacterium phage Snape]QBI97918.1 hypothetical protein SEA_ORANGE_94 [Mycobacte
MAADVRSIRVPGHGTYTFDPDVFEEIWADTENLDHVRLRGRVVDEGGFDSLRDIDQRLSRVDLVAMLADYETNRTTHCF